jgi:hypothetical protein
MRESVAVFFALVSMVFITGCGGSSTTATTTYDKLPTPFASYSAIRGNRIANGPLQLPFTNFSTISGSSVGFSNHSTATSPPAKYNRPMAVTTDGTYLYVADNLNHAIRQINIATGVDKTIAGNVSGLAGSTDGTGNAASFNLPRDITTDGTNLYVADSGNYMIRKIVISTGVVTTIAGAVGAVGSIDADIGTNARFNVINGITTDGISLYVTDSKNTIRRIALSGTFPVTTLAGTPGTSGSTDGTQGAARFNLPQHITTDGPNLYVTDFTASTIRKIVLATGAVTTIAGKFEPGGAVGSNVDSTDGTGQTARFNHPDGITTDGFNLYVTDSYDNLVRKIVLNSTTVYSGLVTTLANNGAVDVTSTVGITTDGISLFITDFTTTFPAGNLQHRIRKIQ